MNVAEFIDKWRTAQLSESSASQQHFLDLCDLVDHPKPAEVDSDGSWFTFEKGATKRDGGDGWADVWKKRYFAWEYKGRRKDLDAAYRQLDQYREALENPPLLVACDMERLVVHTNFTNTPATVHDIPLGELGRPRNLEILRAVFHAPQKLKPGATSVAITTDAAERIAGIAVQLRERGVPPRDVAHFLDRIVFSFFAEDVGLLPGALLTRLLDRTRRQPERFARLVGELFAVMARGGDFGVDEIRHFNGNLFEPGPIPPLTRDELEALYAASRLDWSVIDPSIVGTLFERGLDPDKRSQLGAHYTRREDIEAVVEPVVLRPLRREWNEIRRLVENLLATGRKRPKGGEPRPTGARLRKAQKQAEILVGRFHRRLVNVKVLDPACGVLQKLKDLEKEVVLHSMDRGLPGLLPMVGPWQLYGIEANPYAHELAQTTVWIGYLQWIHQNGMGEPDDPVLRQMTNVECEDAILDRSDPCEPREPDWPRVDFIVGNPPFLGGKKMRGELGDDYVDDLFAVWRGRVPAEADLVCYWFEKARAEIAGSQAQRAGLLATQGIRGGASREVLHRIKETGDLFFAESDRPWVLDGASVHVSMIGFDDGRESERSLDGEAVESIHADLTSTADLSRARRLREARSRAFMGDTKGGAFDLGEADAFAMLTEVNPHARPNSDVLRPWINGRDVTQRRRWRWIVDFGTDRDEERAALYEAPFEHLRHRVLPQQARRRAAYRENWWRHTRPRPRMRDALHPLPRFLCTPTVAKHRLFVWARDPTLPDHQLIAFALPEDADLGLLHSRIHETWALALGTRLETRPRYTPTTCFETFPFPDATAKQRAAIAAAARELDERRERWLEPSEWTREEVLEFPGSLDGPWARFVHEPDARGIGTVRYPRRVPRDDEAAAKLARRTLTRLYNRRPGWLDGAHRTLDEAVAAAYGWPPDLGDDEILERLLALNLERAARR